MLINPPIAAADIRQLLPGQAVHLGHSSVLINVAGLRVLLDPATLDGTATAPFANLIPGAHTRLQTYQPLFDFTRVVSSVEVLAQAADVVLYSHLHADHFAADVLQRLMACNPRLRAILPQGTTRLLRAPRSALGQAFRYGLRALARSRWLDTTPDGLAEYLGASEPDLPWARTFEVADGAVFVLRNVPRVVLRVFAVRHPRPLMWVPTPFEAAYPPVLGFEIGYDDRGCWRHVLLVGESALDAGVLQRIHRHAASLTAAFLPISLPVGGPLLAPWYAHVCHAPPSFLALATRLAEPRTKIVPIHQGLWCYDFRPTDVPDLSRDTTRSGQTPRAQTVEDALVAAMAYTRFGPRRLRAWRRLTDVLAASPPQAMIADPVPGLPFEFQRSPVPAPVTVPSHESGPRWPLTTPVSADIA